MSERPIILRPSFIVEIRNGARRHVCMPGRFIPGQRSAIGAEAKERAGRSGAMSMPTPWASLEPGDKLWVQEQISGLFDERHNEVAKTYYTLDLQSGRVPIPGGVRGGKWSTKSWDATKCPKNASRYTLEITGVRLFTAREITWPEVEREGTYRAYDTLGAWWGRFYGVTLPWEENPPVVGLDFTFIDGNIETGQRWVQEIEPAPHAGGAGALIEKMFGTPPIKEKDE